MIALALTTDLKQVLGCLERWLHATETTHAKKFNHSARREQYLAGRGLLRWLACRTFAVMPEQVMIEKAQNGAPLLNVNGQAVSCSISHTDNAATVALRSDSAPDATIGLDIEVIQPRRHQRKMLARFADGFFTGLTESDVSDFFQRWTLAEAVTKAEQGALLKTLRRKVSDYSPYAYFHAAHGYQLCCYVPEQPCLDEQLQKVWPNQVIDIYVVDQTLQFRTL